jgi:hypothetical protein
MKGIMLGAAVALGVAALGPSTAAMASSEAYSNWVQGLTQNGWRLVAESEPLKAALLMGPDSTDATGRRITAARYEFMDQAGQGGWKTLVVNDAIDCKVGTIARVKVIGYPANNLGGQAVEQKAEAQPVTASPNSFLEEEVHYACGMATTLHIAAAPADPKKKVDDPNKMICHTEAVLGSTIPVRRCETKLQAAERRHDDQEAVERGQREIGIISH